MKLSIVYKVVIRDRHCESFFSTCSRHSCMKQYAIEYRKLRIAKPSFPNSKLIVFSNINAAREFIYQVVGMRSSMRKKVKILKCVAKNTFKPKYINTIMNEESAEKYWMYFDTDDPVVRYNQFDRTDGIFTARWKRDTLFCDNLIPFKEVKDDQTI